MPIDPDFWKRLRRLDQVLKDRSRQQQRGIEYTKPLVPAEAISDAASKPNPAGGVEAILEAAMKSKTLVSMVYKAKTRLIEPYKVETAMNARVAHSQVPSPRNGPPGNPIASLGSNRILWAWDETTIKSFIISKIERISPTNISFNPKFPIEGIKP